MATPTNTKTKVFHRLTTRGDEFTNASVAIEDGRLVLRSPDGNGLGVYNDWLWFTTRPEFEPPNYGNADYKVEVRVFCDNQYQTFQIDFQTRPLIQMHNNALRLETEDLTVVYAAGYWLGYRLTENGAN